MVTGPDFFTRPVMYTFIYLGFKLDFIAFAITAFFSGLTDFLMLITSPSYIRIFSNELLLLITFSKFTIAFL